VKPILFDRFDVPVRLAEERQRWRARVKKFGPSHALRLGISGRHTTEAEVLAAVEALPDDCTIEALEAVRGFNFRQRCDGCGQACDRAVLVGQEPDDESATAQLCRSCVLDALALFGGRS
jgi:hypothetical protein